MLLDTHSEAYFDHDARARAYDAISTREKKLPEDALRLLANEVITRLASRFAVQPERPAPSDDSLEALGDALISDDPHAGLSFVNDLRRHDVPRDVIYLGYLAGAARRLGERWDRDEIPFTSVSIAAGRLYIIMRALRPTFLTEATHDVGYALFAATPGEVHTLGVTMAADMFRERGWDIDLETDLSHDELVEKASTGAYPIIGLSASHERMVVPLTRLIASLRVISPASSIMVSGELTAKMPDLASIVDADSIVSDATAAIEAMQRVINSPPVGARN